MREKIINTINKIATGNKSKRRLLAPLVGGTFAVVTFLFAAVPVYIGNSISNGGFISPTLSYIISLPLLAIGVTLMLWTSIIFYFSKGTPVPVDPPEKLITSGPYKFTRNPMHTGLFLVMIASGFFYASILSLVIFTPVYIILDTLMIKFIEEPGLEKRLGEDYIEYKKRTPMFFPWR